MTAQKKQRKHYSGKKKSHSIKSQVLIDQRTQTILATCFSSGRTSDLRLLQASKLSLSDSVTCYADSGYQGTRKMFPMAKLPLKKPYRGQLTDKQKQANKEQRQERIRIEHTIRRLKIFKILAYRLRFNLIAALLNKDLPEHL